MATQIDINEIARYAEVVGSDHKHVGKVDHLEGTDEVKLVKNEDSADNMHHIIPTSWIDSIHGRCIVLNKTASEAKQQWKSVF